MIRPQSLAAGSSPFLRIQQPLNGAPFLIRYRDYRTYLQEIYGERVHKIAIDAGMTCPNRDGTISSRGCIYCDPLGSGTGAMIRMGKSIEEQIAAAKARLGKRFGARKFIAYFQSFTNTYAPYPRLAEMYRTAMTHEGVVGLAVGTRPDCVTRDTIDLLASHGEKYPVWIEYGLQSAHDQTLVRINRGHDVACFERAVLMAREAGLNVCAHVILGLPGEDREKMLDTATYLASIPIQGVKMHLLYVVRGTGLGELYERGDYVFLGRGAYVDLVVDFLERLPAQVVIQRLTGDPPKACELLGPMWAREKSRNLQMIRQRLEERDTWQGRLAGKKEKGLRTGV